jgi:hypothetical protein
LTRTPRQGSCSTKDLLAIDGQRDVVELLVEANWNVRSSAASPLFAPAAASATIRGWRRGRPRAVLVTRVVTSG